MDEVVLQPQLSVEACAPCSDIEFQTEFPSTTNSRECELYTNCTEDEFESVAPAEFSDRECLALTTCRDAQFQRHAPTQTSDRVCENVTVCEELQFEAQAPTSTSDRSCLDVTVCSGEQFQVKAPTQTSDRECEDLTVCLDDQFETDAPDTTTDRQCQDHTVCSVSLEFQTVAPTLTSDRQCQSLTMCVRGQQFESTAPTASSDRECTDFLCPGRAELSEQVGSVPFNLTCDGSQSSCTINCPEGFNAIGSFSTTLTCDTNSIEHVWTGLLPHCFRWSRDTAVPDPFLDVQYTLQPPSQAASNAQSFRAVGEVPTGLFVQSATGAILGSPTVARDNPFLFELRAEGGSDFVVVEEFQMVVRRVSDCSNVTNGPNEQGCFSGTCLDLVEFDNSFTCNCSGTEFTGDNCQLVRAASSASSIPVPVIGGGAALLVLVALLALLFVYQRRRAEKARRVPIDFAAQLKVNPFVNVACGLMVKLVEIDGGWCCPNRQHPS